MPAGWVWGDHGFLNRMGVVDIAGSGPVHLVGGVSGNKNYAKRYLKIFKTDNLLLIYFICRTALACAIMLGPRIGRYDNGIEPLPLGCPVNAIMGLFVLW
jgi:ammonia channel protein AmtB